MDLSNIASHNSKLEILHPGTGEPVGLTLEILPPDHSDIKTEMRRLIDMRRHKQQRNQPATAADDERASIALCIRAVVGWEWTKDAAGALGDWNGERPEFNRTVLADMMARDWLRIQVDRHLNDDKAFYQA
jgi:hypothetical protein